MGIRPAQRNPRHLVRCNPILQCRQEGVPKERSAGLRKSNNQLRQFILTSVEVARGASFLIRVHFDESGGQKGKNGKLP